jgi:hypothetical protein
MKSVKGTIQYLQKEDKKPLIYGDVPLNLEDSRVAKSDLVAKMIVSGSNLQEIANTYPGYFMLNKKKIEDFVSFTSLRCQRESLLPMKLPILYTGSHQATKNIVDWLNTNLRVSRKFKSKQLWIHGPTNYRKTSLLMTISEHMMIYPIPLREDFYDSYDEDVHEIAVFDEFKGQKTIQFLNLFLQGSIMTLAKKGSQYLKKKNIPVIILSNYAPNECYKVPVDTLLSRIDVLALDEPIDLDNMNWNPPEPQPDPAGS